METHIAYAWVTAVVIFDGYVFGCSYFVQLRSDTHAYKVGQRVTT